MGFFVKDAPVVIAEPRGRAPKAKAALDPAARGCDNCSLKDNWNWITSPQMPLSGNLKDPDILVLGEAPLADDDKEGIAWMGDPGRMLRRVLPGREMDRLAFQNIVRCRVRNDAGPAPREAHACSLHLEDDIARHPSIKAIIGIGQAPLARFFPGQSISRMNGIRFPVQVGSRMLWYFPVIHPSFILEQGGDRSAAYPQLKSDVRKFFQEVDRWPAPKMLDPDPEAVLLPNTRDEAEDILAAMEERVGIDIETTGLRFALKGAKILSAAVSDGHITMAFPIEHPEAANDWGLPFLLNIIKTSPWVAHNAVFELVWMLHARNQLGLDFEPAPFEDSMAIGRILHERSSMLGEDLMTRIHLGINFKQFVKVNVNNLINEQLIRVLQYNGLDALATILLYKELRGRLRGDPETNYKRLLGGIRSTAEMELRGLDIDRDEVYRLKDQWHAQYKKAEADARLIYEVREFERTKQIEFNIASSDHIGEALVEFGRIDLPKTRGGKGQKWSTDDQDLRAKAPDNPLVKIVLEYREAQKIESTYIEPVIHALENNFDGRVHPSYTCMHTETGRLSSEAPNIQNFPKRRHREIRRMVVAPAGHLIVSFDYGQIEARCFAFASKDRALCESIIRKIDIHSRWRDRALELHPEYIKRLEEKTNETELKKVLKGGRDIIKTDFVFAQFFGSTASSCAKRTDLPLAVAEKMSAEFWRAYPDVQKWVKARRREYDDTGSSRTLTGMVRHQILGGNEPLNTPIQGTSTGHMVLEAQNALSELSREMNDPYLHPRINIHDDLTFILPDEPDLLQAYIEIIATELVKIRFDFQIVPLMVEAKVGYNWADLEEVAEFIGDYLR